MPDQNDKSNQQKNIHISETFSIKPMISKNIEPNEPPPPPPPKADNKDEK